MKILHLPSNIGGNAAGLSKAEKKTGLDSSVLVSQVNRAESEIELHLQLSDKNLFSLIISFFKATIFFFKIRNKYDIFHFNFGTSLINFDRLGLFLLELPFYPHKAKKFVTYNGCEGRMQSKIENIKTVCNLKDCHDCSLSTNQKLKKITKMAKYTDHMFSVNPDLLYSMPSEKSSFIPYTIAVWDELQKVDKYFYNSKIKIVHAPSNRRIKGSSHIIAAIEKLKKKYPNQIEFELIENLPYKQALQKYKECDILIDQVILGWYGALAVEGMKLGKAVAVYIDYDKLDYISEEMQLELPDAFIEINKDNIESVLTKYIVDRNKIIKKAQNGHNYVLKWHDPVKIAEDIKNKYYDKI